MRIIFITFTILITGCSHKERVLSASEMQQLGLTAMIFDAPICPTTVDPKTGKSIVVGECELVTCENVKEKLICKAVKQDKKKLK